MNPPRSYLEEIPSFKKVLFFNFPLVPIGTFTFCLPSHDTSKSSDDIMQGFTILPTWLTTLVPSLKPKPRPRRSDPFDYDPLPPPRLRSNRFPITRSTSPDRVSSLESSSTLQPQPVLLKVLPREIRQRIWTHVLEGHTVHLEIMGGCLGCIYCLSAVPNACNEGRCAPRMEASALPERARKLLSLLRTCRQM